jgi:hypothetical protein
MAWKWIRISLESWMVSWYKNEIIRAGVSNCMRQCLNVFGTKHTHSRVPGLRGGYTNLYYTKSYRLIYM